ncbi:hypothetical protein C1I98_00860 [Spongiactinospora gelatinilytica]|uniref:IclR-ED domain-containing protein n=1 Tax=Spongiactinospora gelatinilytica TaxID=2666298 RepID=A0A2W2H7G6_9ACTN|nr:hypothetical protein C1I98_00860 [Spongiactinospora gelatinilytica]
MTCTGVGKALLAHAEAELLEEVLHRPLRRLTPYSIVDPARLKDEIRRIRTTGVAYEREEARLGIARIAAPIFRGGTVVAAVSIAAPATRFHPPRPAPAVKTAALGVSRAPLKAM